MNKIWNWIIGLFTVLLGLFFYERSGRKQAEAKLESAEFDSKDQVLTYQQKEEQDKIAAEKQKIEELRKQHDQDSKSNQELTPEQVEEYWKKK